MVIGLIDRLSRPLMRALDPEDAHALTIKALRFMPLARPAPEPKELSVRAFGLNFPNPVGLAAGFDKNAQVPDALLRLGSGLRARGHGADFHEAEAEAQQRVGRLRVLVEAGGQADRIGEIKPEGAHRQRAGVGGRPRQGHIAQGLDRESMRIFLSLIHI